ncbi:type VI secretion system Vgr family protein [Chondromyces crocatus]|uniref:type VI secretion system Vgr family protein n=1 Tax=Chondromyces crocatus TaxID=52 RepID=UPI001FE07F0B|nr:type VI secretion system tip protein TssI/VgrG [Chondromyces crocatus]
MSSAGAIASDLQKPNFELRVDSGDILDVREFQVQERFSSLFEVQLRVVSPNPDIDFDAVLGKPALFRIQRNRLVGTLERLWRGICCRIQQVGVEDEGLSTYELTIVPTLWFLTQRRNHRIFQQLSDLEIVLKLLAEWDITPVMSVDQGAYKKRKYRVQYGESDYSFVCRLLEDAGISFYFDQVDDETKLVLNDAPQDNPPRGSLPFIERPMVDKDEEFATEVRVQQRTRPGKYTIFDHDYRRPASFKLQGTHSAGDAIEQRMERFHYVPGMSLFRSDGREPTPSADDKGSARHDEGEAARIARHRLEAKRASAKSVVMRVHALDVRTGTVLSVSDHPHRELEKPLLVVEATYEGTYDGAWKHRIEARSAALPYRPPLATEKPKADGCESATVVGPAGEEIHVDEFGRVRVQFHWDREGGMNQDSSCWIHVSQPWGGAGFGGMNLPRIGQEVIVDFLNADPDRPVIVGRVYTNLQKVPYALPANKTQSGLRSNSSPSNGGYSELMFEDSAGKELVRFQAQKDFSGLVKNDFALNIGHDRQHHVNNDDRESVTRDQYIQVGEDRLVSVGRDQIHSVKEHIIQHAQEKSLMLYAYENVLVQSVGAKEIRLKCGKSVIIMSDEHIIIQGDMVHINPSLCFADPPPPPVNEVNITPPEGFFFGAP